MRSIPHDPDALEANVLYPSDLNGDGYALTMRLENPDGEWKPDAEDPRLLVRRQADDEEGPFYRQYPEGLVHDWDGRLDHVAVPREYGEFASSIGGTGGLYTDVRPD